MENNIANGLRILGWVALVLGIIGGYFLAHETGCPYGDANCYPPQGSVPRFNLGMFVIYTFISTVVLVLLLAIAEIIRLLEENVRK